MNEASRKLILPPRSRRADGELRRVGVELELGGMDIEPLSALVGEVIGGEISRATRYEHEVSGDPAGAWKIELDFELLKEMGREAEAAGEGERDLLDKAAENVLRKGANQVVPLEVVSPPLPLDRLAEVEVLIDRLREEGALGTGAGLTYAFGLQLNPEMPDLEARTISAYLQAFLCLYEWLLKKSTVDSTRRLTRFAAPFPGAYVRQVVDPAYRPSLETLIDDYLKANPTRNRPLDLLPLFLHLDEDRVRAVVEDPRVKPRPALHYRLPNCEVDRPGWGLHEPWNDWLQVECLAADEDRLAAMRRKYAEHLDKTIGQFFEDWAEEVGSWLVTPQDL